MFDPFGALPASWGSKVHWIFRFTVAALIAEIGILPWWFSGTWIEPAGTILFLIAVLASVAVCGFLPGLLTVALGLVASVLYGTLAGETSTTAAMRRGLEVAIWIAGALALEAAHRFMQVREYRKHDAERVRLRHIVDEMPVPLFVIDVDGRVLGWNEGAERTFGWVAADVEGKVLPTIPLEREQRSSFRRAVEKVLRGETVERVEVVQRRRHRPDMMVQMWASPLRGTDGEIEGLVCVFDDVTEKKEAEIAVRQNAARLQALVEELDVGVLVMGPEAEILSCNPRTLQLLGVTENQLLGRSAHDPNWGFLREDGTAFATDHYPMVEVLITGRPVQRVLGVQRPRTGDRVWLLAQAHPVVGEGDAIERVVCTLTDITELKQAPSTLRRLSSPPA